VAVLGTGLDRIYPPEHARLAAGIAAQGALLSEFPLGSEPEPWHFPLRNRVISGLSRGVVVVEAAARSGALITADCALEQGRDVFAVPGPVTAPTSQGTHQLLKQGARLVTSAEDILEEWGLSCTAGVPRSECSTPSQDGPRETALPAASRAALSRSELPEPEQRVFACVAGEEPQDIETIASHSGLPMAEVASTLLTLELKRLVRQQPGKRFVRRS
jgi:DNA processing protein